MIMATASKQPQALPFIHPDDMPDRYCLTGVGTCMEPTIPNGSLVAFDKHETPRQGDVVCLTFTREAARRYGVPGMVKRLSHDLLPGGFDVFVDVEQMNPPKRLGYWSSELLAIHKFVGIAERREDGSTWLRLQKKEA
jgi:hypothetical protein